MGGFRGLLFSKSKIVGAVNIPNILDTIQQYQVKQKQFKTNTGGGNPAFIEYLVCVISLEKYYLRYPMHSIEA